MVQTRVNMPSDDRFADARHFSRTSSTPPKYCDEAILDILHEKTCSRFTKNKLVDPMRQTREFVRSASEGLDKVEQMLSGYSISRNAGSEPAPEHQQRYGGAKSPTSQAGGGRPTVQSLFSQLDNAG
ncbi:hypothetical protein WR25_03966 [Diploscapter pachys]|uniref:Uncharacterized protein n=1 Tax=Diploscapter pachys TaxID=2018661 RepID=A0A2A2JL26_9BILA|nr:hypothetical protein WR25_03966 [Diploscapter pachys]